MGLRGVRGAPVHEAELDGYELFIFLMDDDGQAGADLQAIHGEMAPRQDAQLTPRMMWFG